MTTNHSPSHASKVFARRMRRTARLTEGSVILAVLVLVFVVLGDMAVSAVFAPPEAVGMVPGTGSDVERIVMRADGATVVVYRRG